MAGYLSNSQIAIFQSGFQQHFNTFKRLITINREPIKTLIADPTQPYAGYGNETDLDNFTLTPVSGSYYAHIIYPRAGSPKFERGNTQDSFADGKTRIKVDISGRNYIESGKVENILVDGKTYNLGSQFTPQNYVGQTYYWYELCETN